MSPVSARAHFSLPLSDGRVLELGTRTLVMGILNITPDSFADTGARMDPDRALSDALDMVRDGVDILDIGGESTRPGAPPVPAEEEWRRVAPVLERLRGRVGVPVSIDTYKAHVAAKALAAGATIVNDVSALTFDPPLANVAARAGAAVVLMHHRGRSDDMYARAQYADVVSEVIDELTVRVAAARDAGIDPERIIVDPGIGFAKRAVHSMAVLGRLDAFAVMGRPILSGPSRKSFLKQAIGDVPPHQRVWGTAAAVTASVLAGAPHGRGPDVREMVQVARVADAIRSASS